MEQTLDLGWELLATLPRNALDRCDAATLDKYYEPAKARISKNNPKDFSPWGRRCPRRGG